MNFDSHPTMHPAPQRPDEARSLSHVSHARRAAAAALMAAVLAGCGGGGGSPGVTFPASSAPPPASSAPPPSPDQVPVADVIVPSSSVAQRCSIPEEKSWVRGWIDETYLWYDEIPASIQPSAYATPLALFNALKTPVVTPSGKPKDKYHFTYNTAVWQSLSNSGVEAGYGIEWSLLSSQPPRDIRVAYTDPGTPAAMAGVPRGARVLSVDGVDAVNSPTVDVLNAGLFPSATGQTHSIRFQEPDGHTRTVSLLSSFVTKVPVQNVKVIDTPTGRVGYLLFNDHIATSEAQLVAAIGQLKAAAVQDLVLDMRYNGGGLLGIASALAFMVAGPGPTTGAVFERLEFNRKNPFGLSDTERTTPFRTQGQGFSTPFGEPLPTLGLSRVTVLTGPDTCSASEAVINGLRGVNVQVNLIGETTCGKPYGFIPQDNCGTTYFAIQFKGVNNQGFSDYTDGMAPTCQVADDFSRPLGDPAEQRLAAALSYRETGVCPPATASPKAGLVAGTGAALRDGKTPARKERLFSPGQFGRP